MVKKYLQNIATPAYVADIAKLKENLKTISKLKEATSCKVIFALKACSQFSLFDVMRPYFDGTTASGIYEAKLGHEEFHKEVHVYSPAYSKSEVDELARISDHIYFNSISQLNQYCDLAREMNPQITIGLRVNAGISLVKNNSIYDPSSPCSRFGVDAKTINDDVLDKIDLLHFHNLCENLDGDSVKLINHISEKYADLLKKVKYVNLGGGHYINHKDYDLQKLIDAVNILQDKFDIQAILEPGGAIAYDAGYLVTSVLDVIVSGGKNIAILDTSATCHMPDVLEVPYRPNIIDSGEEKEFEYDYLLAGKTCLTGDNIGDYSFKNPLKAGDKLIFTDMLQYSMVKNTTFNGVPLPDIGILNEDGSYKLVKRFGYEDFKNRLS
ncbi:MAG: carboxynorspermidine decarboxylase [Rickettsiales bacterium]|jgi:carboxynorspermidine decarboxylase